MMEPPYDTLIKGYGDNPCWHCNTPTRWVDVYFEAPLCSAECAEAKWAEYGEAERGSRKDTPRMTQNGYFCSPCQTIAGYAIYHPNGVCSGLKFELQLLKISDGGGTTTPDTTSSHVEPRARRVRLEDLVFTFIALFGLYLWLRRLAK